jgi:starch phosphorylase
MHPLTNSRRIAYFSMEIALDPDMPTYSGGLGILAGDTLRSAADLGFEMVAVSLIHHKGYFHQVLDAEGRQTEQPDTWNPSEHLHDTGVFANLKIQNRDVRIRIWQYDVKGLRGHIVPAYLLDTDVPQNPPEFRKLTDSLYGGDNLYRLQQEIVLGLGGLEALRALGHNSVEVYHMNEGHSSLLTLGLLESCIDGQASPTEEQVLCVRRKCVFTTHTPVPAGHDKFPREVADKVLGERLASLLAQTQAYHDGFLNMTYLALRFSHYVNGVAMHHGEVSRGMFPGYPIHAITNGVHAGTWTSPAFQELFDRHVPEWRGDNLYLRYSVGIPADEIAAAHLVAKRAMIAEVKKRTDVQFDEKTLTIGFARRATKYKRAGLLFSNLERLKYIAREVGPLQLVFAGKAHPADLEGKEEIRGVFEAAAALRGRIPVVFLDNYDMRLAQTLTSGVDVWLNTPQRPQEASGTSGMKAALNGVPSLSILDGWWIEGCVEGVTGWAIGSEELPLDDSSDEIASLYSKLESVVIPMYYGKPKCFHEVMRSAIALNASFFNTDRMVEQYLGNAYALETSVKPVVA